MRSYMTRVFSRKYHRGTRQYYYYYYVLVLEIFKFKNLVKYANNNIINNNNNNSLAPFYTPGWRKAL